MRYLFSVIADRNHEVSARRDEALAINTFNEKLEAAGQREIAAGVASPDHAKLFDNRDGRGQINNHPAVDSDLFMAGFWIIKAEDDATAYQLAAEASQACNRLIEVRPLL
jgi:hypothetical protein